MSYLTRITGPATDPVTLGEAKDHLRVTSNDDEGLIAGYLLAARKRCESETGRAFVTETWEIGIDESFPSVALPHYLYTQARIILPKPPVQSVTSITYVDTTGATQTLASNQYLFTKGDIFGTIQPAYNVTWPTTRNQFDAVIVRFVSGYATDMFPDEIRMAMLLLIAHWYQNREAVNIDSRFSTVLPFGVEALLAPFRAICLL